MSKVRAERKRIVVEDVTTKQYFKMKNEAGAIFYNTTELIRPVVELLNKVHVRAAQEHVLMDVSIDSMSNWGNIRIWFRLLI